MTLTGGNISTTDKLESLLSKNEKPMHLKEIYDSFEGIAETTIRGRLNDSVGSKFDRIGKGLYIIKGKKGSVGLINGDARKLDNKFKKESIDLLLSDHAWLDEKSHKGGNRSFAKYDCFKLEQEDFNQKANCLKKGGFLAEFLPEKNSNNKQYLRDIEDMAEKAGFEYFAEVNISGGNSNIGKKKKYISTLHLFSKGKAGNLKINDKKLKEKLKNGNFEFLKENQLTDFKKIYSEVLSITEQSEKDFIKDLPIINAESFNEEYFQGNGDFFQFVEDKYMRANGIFGMEMKGERLSKYENYIHNLPDSEKVTLFESFNTKNRKEALKKDGMNGERFDIPKHYIKDSAGKELVGYVVGESMIQGLLGDKYISIDDETKEIRINKDSIGQSVIMENFEKHLMNSELPQFKKMKKILIQKEKAGGKIEGASDIEFGELVEEISFCDTQISDFRSAYKEYISLLKDESNYMSGTKVMLPEFFIGEMPSKSELRHESQKPKNVIEDIILQTTNEGANVGELFMGSGVGAEAVIDLGEDGFGWRNYFGIEGDLEIFTKTVEFLNEKYKNHKIYSVEDFYLEGTEKVNKLGLFDNDFIDESYKKLFTIKEKINEDLVGELSVDFLNNSEIKQSGLTAIDFKEVGNIMSIKRQVKGGKIKELLIRNNKKINSFELYDSDRMEVIKTSAEGKGVDEILVGMYNTYR